MVVVGLLAAVYGRGIGSVKLHPDESQWIATSAALEDYVGVKLDSPTWQESYWTLTQPPVVRYVIGLGRRAGGYGPHDLNPAWDWSRRADANIHAGAVPSGRLLWWSRLPMVLLAIATCVLGFLLLRRSPGRIAAWTWTGLWLLNPFFHVVLRRAMGEAPLLAGVTAVLFLCARAVEGAALSPARPSWRYYLWFAGVGLGVGLAGGVKLNGLSTMGAGVACALLYGVVGRESSWPRRLFVSGAGAATVVACATVTFVGLNPYLWPSPLARTRRMIDFRFEEIAIQKRAFPGAPIDTIGQRAQVFPERILNRYAALKLGRRASGAAAAGMVLNGLLTALGLSWLARRAWRHLRRRAPDPVAVAILIVGVSAAGPVLWTPLDWSRYYLLPVYVTTLLIAVGIDRSFGWARRLVLARATASGAASSSGATGK